MATVKISVESGDHALLQEMAQTSGQSVEKHIAELINAGLTEWRNLRIRPSRDFSPPSDDDDLDEEAQNRRKPRATLTTAQEEAVCKAFKSGMRSRELALRFGVSQPTIYRVLVRGVPNYPRQIHHRRKAAQNAQNKNHEGSAAND